MERIRELRQQMGLSQVKLAVMAEMDPATLNRLEQGKGNPNLRTLERVAEALGVEVADFFPKAQASLPDFVSQERRATVFADALIATAERMARTPPPESLGDVRRALGSINVLFSIASPLLELTEDEATWENRFSADERQQIMSVASKLHRALVTLIDQNGEYLERTRGVENGQTTRESEAMRERIREWTRRISA